MPKRKCPHCSFVADHDHPPRAGRLLSQHIQDNHALLKTNLTTLNGDTNKPKSQNELVIYQEEKIQHLKSIIHALVDKI